MKVKFFYLSRMERDFDVAEKEVNEWLASHPNIIVQQIQQTVIAGSSPSVILSLWYSEGSPFIGPTPGTAG